MNIIVCPKCNNNEVIIMKHKYLCKKCNYEFLKQEDNNIEKCKSCSSTILVKYKDFYNGRVCSPDSEKYVCYICKTNQFDYIDKR